MSDFLKKENKNTKLFIFFTKFAEINFRSLHMFDNYACRVACLKFIM